MQLELFVKVEVGTGSSKKRQVSQTITRSEMRSEYLCDGNGQSVKWILLYRTGARREACLMAGWLHMQVETAISLASGVFPGSTRKEKKERENRKYRALPNPHHQPAGEPDPRTQ